MTLSTDLLYFQGLAAEARRSLLEATNPRVRAIYRELVLRFRQSAKLPNLPAGDAVWSAPPCSTDAPLAGAEDHDRTGWQEGRTANPSPRPIAEWENEGGALRSIRRPMSALALLPALSAADDVVLTRDLPEVGLTKGWPGQIIYHNGPLDRCCVVQFFWEPQWQHSDMWSIPLDALARRDLPLDQFRTRRQASPWLRDQ